METLYVYLNVWLKRCSIQHLATTGLVQGAWSENHIAVAYFIHAYARGNHTDYAKNCCYPVLPFGKEVALILHMTDPKFWH